MAHLTAKVPRRIAWSAQDVLELWIGSENAASLAASSPAGGSKVAEVLAWGDAFVRGGLGFDALGLNPLGHTSVGYGLGMGELGYGELGIHDAPRAVLTHEHRSADKCAVLPVGVKVRDACGNISTVFETTVQIHDPPQGARNLAIASTGTSLQARLSWDPSEDVE